ncbi:acetyltransferase [Clostridium botulinum]|nr:acetyltransferase [Clostridium botulinum]APQ75481.1 putative acetyltransferase [Clostridium botulinum]KEI80278.1 acetyltransferase [Clostridium botulinum B2 331]MBN3347089.1 acetyltransferase [Clostridium botulinum]MBN3352752.1 acetyltransferase [Clostridium botulinum]MCC5417940.1 acetyltransferase [Clostridium botulinum]
METLKLIFSSKKYEKQILDYKKEFEIEGEIMHDTAVLEKSKNFD